MSAECGKCFDAKECLQFGCQKPERKMETAKDILNQELWNGAKKIFAAIKAANSFGGPINEGFQLELEENWYDWLKEFTEKREREIADKAWEAGRSHEHAAHFGSVPNVHPDKPTFMKSLFPETK